MKKIIINKTIILFLNIDEILTLKRAELKSIKNKYLKKYDNCVIYNYFTLKEKKEIIRDRLNKLKFINQKRIHTRKCDVKHISNEEKNEFLNKYHIQGTDNANICYGVFNNNELISVMTFNDTNKMTKNLDFNDYELSRFSVKSGIILVGVFKKILKRFISEYKPQKIVSYGDLNIINKCDNIYKSNGFKSSKQIPPDFQYYHIEKNKLYHKYTYGTKFKKNTPQHIAEKEYENLFKFWNCGKIRYELFVDDKLNTIHGFIYQIKNLVNNKIYIGQTIRPIHKRIYEYKSALKFNRCYNQYLLNAFNKYGWNSFEFTVLDTASTSDELNKKEVFYIKKFDTTNKRIGYNIEIGGRNSIPSTETLKKMSASRLNRKQDEIWINKRIAPAGSDEAKKYGRKKTDEEKKLISEGSPKYWLGKNRDEETKRKISETKKERGLSDKQKKLLYKKVFVRDAKTNKIIKTFDSTTEAGRVFGKNQSTISRWCSKNKIVNNEKWSYI